MRHATASTLALVSLALAGCAVPVEGGEDPSTLASELSVHKVDRITTISYAPNSFVIGNAYPGWTDDVQGDPQFSHGPGNPQGSSYRWGFLCGENFDHCAWIEDSASAGSGHEQAWKCGAPQEIDTPYFLATYTNGMTNHLPGDGSLTTMHWAGSGCTDRNGYGNVAPWRVPATPANSVGVIPNGRPLRWRYVSKDGAWVLVRDASGVAPNWYFVHRGCVSLANAD
jgi:hypothetical protein